MTDEQHLDLQGRTLTQLVRDEPLLLHEVADGWARVSALWQPCPDEAAGYPGWVRAAHLALWPRESVWVPAASIAVDRLQVLETAREHLGLRYLWGGTSPSGFDCSGLVHHSYRRAGHVVPRDAHAQFTAAEPVELGAEEPGDLYFFAPPGGEMTHVGFVTHPGHLLHAPGGAVIEEVELSRQLVGILAAVGRFTTEAVVAVPASLTA
ncbi:MAG: NlpC/P60 family protein [Nocardioidaceae bacterium]